MSFNYKKIIKIIFYSHLLLNIPLGACLANVLEKYYKNITPSIEEFDSPSLAYLSHPLIKQVFTKTKTLPKQYKDLVENDINKINKKIKYIGESNSSKILDDVIDKEIELCRQYTVFYHGQNIEFLLFQDIYKLLFEKINKKQLMADFILLRCPSYPYNKYNSVKQFLEENQYFVLDNQQPMQNLLLSANPSLFSNNLSVLGEGESTLYYFLFSTNASNVNIINFIQEVFKYFGKEEIFRKFYNEIYELKVLLGKKEKQKTGLLLQIFIPNSSLEKYVYKSLWAGIPYYSDKDIYAPTLAQEIKNYKTRKFILSSSPFLIDILQFRILITQDFLNPENNNIKFFRYYNTKSFSIIEYSKKFLDLSKKIVDAL